MATATLPRTAKAAGIISRQECIPQDDGQWLVRDTATGSGKVHRTSRTGCDCYDAQRGHRCKHQLAVVAEEQALAAYATGWDRQASAARPCCPMCGCAIEPRAYYVGGRGYVYVEVCSGDATHSNRRG